MMLQRLSTESLDHSKISMTLPSKMLLVLGSILAFSIRVGISGNITQDSAVKPDADDHRTQIIERFELHKLKRPVPNSYRDPC
mmetsp:Transcript_17120/g.55303  ORF Transcript_17120/g.55303 Transcript_17120/m.55303 type:complete len:83 (+) Transcript_17120:1379-1627(+)